MANRAIDFTVTRPEDGSRAIFLPHTRQARIYFAFHYDAPTDGSGTAFLVPQSALDALIPAIRTDGWRVAVLGKTK